MMKIVIYLTGKCGLRQIGIASGVIEREGFFNSPFREDPRESGLNRRQRQ
jgi:hypothetical protein